MILDMVAHRGTSVRYDGYRVLHLAEGGYDHKSGYPAVHPSVNAPSIPFTESMQHLSYDLMKRVSPNITPVQWTRVFGDGTAMCNGQGFGNEVPRKNYIMMEDLDTESELPKLMKAIIFSGTFIRGEKIGSVLRCVPGIHGVDVSKPLPTIDAILHNNWYTYAVSADLVSAAHFIAYTPTPIVYFLKDAVTYPIEWFTEWNDVYLPDPLKFYL